MRTEPEGPTAVMRSPSMRIVWSIFAGEPVPSMTVACVSAITWPLTAMN